MSDEVILNAEVRERVGKGAARATRREGKVPAVIYGGKQAPLSISLEEKEITRQIHKPGFFSHLITVKVGKDKHTVLARDLQLHPLKDSPTHLDFLRVAKDAKIEVAVPVVFINEEKSPGLTRGGMLNIVRHEVELLCTANAIPEELEGDLTGLDIGDSLHISAFALPEGVTPTITDRDFTVATIAAPSAVKAEAAEAAEAEAEDAEDEIEGDEDGEDESEE